MVTVRRRLDIFFSHLGLCLRYGLAHYEPLWVKARNFLSGMFGARASSAREHVCVQGRIDLETFFFFFFL